MGQIVDANQYEKKSCDEIIHWFCHQEELDFFSWGLRKASRPILDFLEKKVPSHLMEGLEVILADSIEKCFHLSNFTTSTQLIYHRLEKEGIKLNDFNQLRLCQLRPLDAVARSFFSEHAIMAALEGASCGLGGITFAIADLPMLITLNFRAILQIALSYGFDVDSEFARLMALKILVMGLLDSTDRCRNEQWNLLAKLPQKWVQHQSEKSVALMGKDRLFLGTVQKLVSRLGMALSKRKLFAYLPLAGGAINAGINYACTRRCTEAAYYLYRYQLLSQRGYNLNRAGVELGS